MTNNIVRAPRIILHKVFFTRIKEFTNIREIQRQDFYFLSTEKYDAEEGGDVVARRKALLAMQRALIQGQEIGDEKLQVRHKTIELSA